MICQYFTFMCLEAECALASVCLFVAQSFDIAPPPSWGSGLHFQHLQLDFWLIWLSAKMSLVMPMFIILIIIPVSIRPGLL